MGVLGSVGSSIIGSDAAGDAADAQVQAGRDAARATERASARGDNFLSYYAGAGSLGAQGINNIGFLFDENEQVDFLQNHPLYNLALENANRATLSSGAARGRISAGDTLEDLSNNVLLNAQPLIAERSNQITNALNFGRDVATARANIAIGEGAQTSSILQGIGNAQAAGTIGQANAIIGGIQGINDTASAALGGFL